MASAPMAATMPHGHRGNALRSVVIGLTAFFTLVDLFAAQAILPSLAHHYHVPASAMGVAVNASTLGMAIASLLVGLFGARIDRRSGILCSLTLLAIPTALLAVAPGLTSFAILRVCQGLCMATAFSLMLAYLGEECSASDTAGAFAAYVTGNVASNLVGRLLSAALADHLGLSANFFVLAGLNLCGAALVFATVSQTPGMMEAHMAGRRGGWAMHLRNPRLLATFAIGFCLLFAFIGTFTYVNFVLVRAPLSLGMMAVGFAYFVFLPAMLTTPMAGGLVKRFGARPTMWASLALAIAGLPLLLIPYLPAVLAGMVLIACGTFLSQAVATGFVGRAATVDRGAATGFYLAAYFAGGLAGSAIVGQLFDRFGWACAVGGVAAALVAAALCAFSLTQPK